MNSSCFSVYELVLYSRSFSVYELVVQRLRHHHMVASHPPLLYLSGAPGQTKATPLPLLKSSLLVLVLHHYLSCIAPISALALPNAHCHCSLPKSSLLNHYLSCIAPITIWATTWHQDHLPDKGFGLVPIMAFKHQHCWGSPYIQL